jgi:Protein of unknown function (DUF3467)
MGRRSSLRSHSPSKGLYANYFEVGHTAFEFVLDFGQTYSARQPCCHTRIVTSPIYARALLATLTKAMEEHEQRFGKGKHESTMTNDRAIDASEER